MKEDAIGFRPYGVLFHLAREPSFYLSQAVVKKYEPMPLMCLALILYRKEPQGYEPPPPPDTHY